MSFFVNALAFRNWANELSARSVLPRLIRKLTTATVEKIEKIDFPAYESTQRPGFDGEVTADIGNAWIPSGHSVWELSVEAKVKPKADSDYEKRVKECPEDVRYSSTYVFVTARQWRNKSKWSAEKCKQGHWKDVRAYDCDDLEQWCEIAPAVGNWFGTLLGTRPKGVDELATRWEAVASSIQPRLLPSVFLAGRERSIAKLEEWLFTNSVVSPLQIECRSPVEVMDFICAWSASLSDEARENFDSRCMIVEELNAWKHLCQSSSGLILVVDSLLDLSPEDITRATNKKHKVILAVELSRSHDPDKFELERPNQVELARALEDCGYLPAEAEQASISAGGSLAILKRRLSRYHQTSKPLWTDLVADEIYSACLLLGGWDASNENDRNAFGELAGRSFADCESSLLKLSSCRDSPLHRVGSKWRLISKDDAWALMGHIVGPSAFSAFEMLAVAILTDDDPKYELEKKLRIAASVCKVIPQYSETIKKHVAETLAFVSTFHETISPTSAIRIDDTTDRIVAAVMSPNATWRRWATLGANLSLLAEAAPNCFLGAIRRDLDKPESELQKLFFQEGELPLGNCEHAGLLWALETLSWSERHLSQVCEFLLKLARLDPGGKWSNRPSSSLKEVISVSGYHTAQSPAERAKLIEFVVERDRETAWPVLQELLEDSGSTMGFGLQKPRWRNWATSWSREISADEYDQFLTALCSCTLTQAGIEPTRWMKLLRLLGLFARHTKTEFVEAVRYLSGSDMTETDKQALDAEFTKQFAFQRRNHEEPWAAPSHFLDEIDAIRQGIKPKSDVMNAVYLFQYSPDPELLGFGLIDGDFQARISSARQDAINKIIATEGIVGIQTLVSHAQAPSCVGESLALATSDEHLQSVLPSSFGGSRNDQEFARGFVWARCFQAGNAWVDTAIRLCTSSFEKASVLTSLQFSPKFWERAEREGTDVFAKYWENCSPHPAQLSAEQIEIAAKELIRANRQASAVAFLSLAIALKQTISAECLLTTLESLASEIAQDRQKHHNLVWDVRSVISAIQDREDADRSRLAQLEFTFLFYLDDHSGHAPKTLFAELTADPHFFVEALRRSYFSRDEAIKAKEGPLNSTVAQQVHRLLRAWKQIPGASADGQIDLAALREWCAKARELASNIGRLNVCDYQIGFVCANSPVEPDGTWPTRPIRLLIAEIGTESIASGLQSGLNGFRGGFRTATGDPERQEAEKYRNYAKAIEFEEPFVAEILNSIADNCERHAKFWDEQNAWDDGI